MLVLLRIVFLALVASVFMTNLGWRKRLVFLSLLGLVMILGTIIVVALSDRTSPDTGSPTRPPITSSPISGGVPRPPSFETACRQFRLVVRDVETGNLDHLVDRDRAFEEIRVSATFPGSPASFVGLFDTYAGAVDARLGVAASNTDVEVLDRAIRRARDDMLSECRARQG